MSDFSFCVNGIEKESPLTIENSFGELIEWVRNKYSSESSCISAIRVDGEDISEREEAAIALLPLSDLKRIEVSTTHPRELAQETLQGLIGFTDHLTTLSTQAAAMFQKGEHPSLELARLFDGMQTFSEALENVKKVIRPGNVDLIQVLEMDLLAVMKELLEYYHLDERTYVIELLSKHLPENMSDWKVHGLPTLIRSRDS